MRRLYLLRHGTASADRQLYADPERPLVEKGREQAKKAARLLQRVGLPQRVVTSPYLRARQTAEAVLTALQTELPLVEDGRLIPWSETDEACQALGEAAEGLPSDGNLLAVGHEPLFSSLTALLTDGAAPLLRKGGIVELEISSRTPLRAELLGLLRPKHL